MQSISLIDQIKSKYITKNIFDFVKDVIRYKLTVGKRSLLDDVFEPASAVIEAKFGISDWPKYPDLFKNVPKDASITEVLAEKLNILNWPRYSEAIYATVKFMANEICDDYAKKLNNGYDKFPEDLKRRFDFYKEKNIYHDSLEKGGAEYFNKEARPYVIKTIIYLLLIEIIDLGCKKKLFSMEALNEYLEKHPKEKSKDINRWFNSLIYRIIYNALEESLKDKENKKSPLNQNINQALCGMTRECMFSNGRVIYIKEENKIILDFLGQKFESNPQCKKNLITNSCFWYIKMEFKEEGKEKDDYYRQVKFNQASQYVQFCIFEGQYIDCDSVNKLLKKDSGFSFLFPNKQIDEKEQTSKEVPKQESIGGKYK